MLDEPAVQKKDQWIIAAVVAVVFVASLILFPKHGLYISPDETANAFFARQFAHTGKLAFFEPDTLTSPEMVAPVSGSIPDPAAEAVRYYRKTGLFPINHGMVIRAEIARRHPWVILNLLKAFERANDIADGERVEHAQYHLDAGLLPPEAARALRTPLVRHGVKANRQVLETAALYSHEQGLTPRRLNLEELFAPSTLEQ